MKPWLKVKVGEESEIDIATEISGLKFLGDTSAPEITNNYQDTTGVDGSTFSYATFNKNIVNANFWLHFKDWYDFKLAVHEIYRIFMNKSLIRIRTDAEPAIVKYVRAATFEITPTESGSHDALFTIPFENPSGYKYSLFKSNSLYMCDEEGWQMGMNLPNGMDLKYEFTHKKIKVYNASDIPIDPYYQRHDLKITCKFVGDYLQIINNTNGSSWKYNASSSGVDIIILDGIATTLNGNPASSSTDYGNLTLEKGWNDISVLGVTSLDIVFEFPFIYIS